MVSQTQLRTAYDVAVDEASTLREKIRAFYHWTVNESTKMYNDLREQGYDSESISSKPVKKEVTQALKQKWDALHGSSVSQQHTQLPRREHHGVRGLYDALEREGFDMSGVKASWQQDNDGQVESSF